MAGITAITVPVAQAHLNPFRLYGPADGLSNPNALSLMQGAGGYILAGTQHGATIFDGRAWQTLGRRQGLPDGGLVVDVWIGADGYILLRYPDEVFASDTPLTIASGLEQLHFHAIGRQDFVPSAKKQVFASWNHGPLIVNAGSLWTVRWPGTTASQPAQLVRADIRLPTVPLRPFSPVAASGSAIFAETEDNQICRMTMSNETCKAFPAGTRSTSWVALAALSPDRVVARSATELVDVNFATGEMAIRAIPDPDGVYGNYQSQLFLLEDPEGGIVTQTAAGLQRWIGGAWQPLGQFENIGQLPILSGLFDRNGELWFSVVGAGIARTLGYGLWENDSTATGLPLNIVWQVGNDRDTPVYVATDSGMATIDATGAKPLRPLDHVSPAVIEVAVMPSGQVWRSVAEAGIGRYDPNSNTTTFFPTPALFEIVRRSEDSIYFTTLNGIFAATGDEAPRRIAGTTGGFGNAVSDGRGGLLGARLDGKSLFHLHADGRLVDIPVDWRIRGFQPLCFALGEDDVLWAGGSGGLFRILLQDDRVAHIEHIDPALTRSSTVAAIAIDKRNWLWAGTDHGVTLFDGTRWRTVTAASGLISDDTDTYGVFADPDGSMWFSTSGGLSHLLHPTRLFQDDPLTAVIDGMRFGDTPYDGHSIPYSKAALTVEFGLLSYGAEGSAHWRYKLEGVDQQWVETTTGVVRYPSVPSGRHRLFMQAFDPLTGQSSPMVSRLIRMRAPWWRSFPALLGWLGLLVAAIYGGIRLRVRQLMRQRRQLLRLVAERTEELERQASALRVAQHALRRQAMEDGLTGLYRRGEVQSRVIARLAEPSRDATLTAALLDLDHFKSINDRFGHLAGDDVLKELGGRVAALCGERWMAGRYGGEEILLVAEGEEAESLGWIQSVYRSVVDTPFLTDGGRLAVTCSIGVSRARATDDWRTLIERVDAALYEAKRHGRNRIVVAPIDVERP